MEESPFEKLMEEEMKKRGRELKRLQNLQFLLMRLQMRGPA